MVNYAFVHGGGQGGWVWAETLEALALQERDQPCRAIAFDLAGCGAKRGQDTALLTTREVAAAFVDELAASEMQGTIVVGHSAAGTILPIAAELRPDLIGRLVYVSCVAPAPGGSVRRLFGDSAQGGHPDEIGWPTEEGLGSDPMTRLREMFCNDMSEVETGAFLARLGQDHWPTLAALEETDWRYDHLEAIPSTYVICLKDRSLPPVWQKRFADRFHVRRRVAIDAGHQVMNTRPHSLAEVLRHEAGLV